MSNTNKRILDNTMQGAFAFYGLRILFVLGKVINHLLQAKLCGGCCPLCWLKSGQMRSVGVGVGGVGLCQQSAWNNMRSEE